MDGANQPAGKNVRLTGKKSSWPWLLILLILLVLIIAALWPRLQEIDDPVSDISGSRRNGDLSAFVVSVERTG